MFLGLEPTGSTNQETIESATGSGSATSDDSFSQPSPPSPSTAFQSDPHPPAAWSQASDYEPLIQLAPIEHDAFSHHYWTAYVQPMEPRVELSPDHRMKWMCDQQLRQWSGAWQI